jgi:hypothetical protein
MNEPRRIHGRLKFEDWSVIDPDWEPLAEALHTARYDLPRLTQSQAYDICEAAQCWLHFAAHPATNKLIFEQLRRVRRAVRSSP